MFYLSDGEEAVVVCNLIVMNTEGVRAVMDGATVGLSSPGKMAGAGGCGKTGEAERRVWQQLAEEVRIPFADLDNAMGRVSGGNIKGGGIIQISDAVWVARI